MSIRNLEELQGIKRVGRVVTLALNAMVAKLKSGISTGELDDVGARVLSSYGARSAPQVCVGFPRATCISVNDEVAHGIPGDRVIQPGDIVNLDVSAELDGFFADTGASFPVAPVSANTRMLCRATRRALAQAVATMRPGVPFNQTGHAVERVARRHGFRPIRDLCAHGVGRWLHEEPLEIANVYDPRDRRRFTEGLVVAMETFLSLGSDRIVPSLDGWTLRTSDGSRAAQFEHTVVVTRNGPLIVTAV